MTDPTQHPARQDFGELPARLPRFDQFRTALLRLAGTQEGQPSRARLVELDAGRALA